MTPDETARESVKQAATEDRGLLLAYLASRYRDFALAEDALSKAFVSALVTWPRNGVPANTRAWLLTAARNAIVDELRRDSVRAAREIASETFAFSTAFPDKRLELLFVCAHPAIDPSIRTPLMLQSVLRLSIERIAGAFVVSEDAMSQRLARAKRKITATGIPFEIPQPEELPERLHAVLEAVYAAYSAGWDGLYGDLSAEAIWLARVLVSLLPDDAESRGLLSLLLHAEARRHARRGPSGNFIPLADQDCSQWSRELLEEAGRHLNIAHQLGSHMGSFQLEAAIQSAHSSRAVTGQIPWADIAALHDALITVRPSLGAMVSRAAAYGEAFNPERGLEALGCTAAHKNRFSYQPYWACRAKLSREAGDLAAAAEAYRNAISLTPDPALRQYLETQQPPTFGNLK